jgi:hypothetical protein
LRLNLEVVQTAVLASILLRLATMLSHHHWTYAQCDKSARNAVPTGTFSSQAIPKNI